MQRNGWRNDIAGLKARTFRPLVGRTAAAVVLLPCIAGLQRMSCSTYVALHAALYSGETQSLQRLLRV